MAGHLCQTLCRVKNHPQNVEYIQWEFILCLPSSKLRYPSERRRETMGTIWKVPLIMLMFELPKDFERIGYLSNMSDGHLHMYRSITCLNGVTHH